MKQFNCKNCANGASDPGYCYLIDAPWVKHQDEHCSKWEPIKHELNPQEQRLINREWNTLKH